MRLILFQTKDVLSIRGIEARLIPYSVLFLMSGINFRCSGINIYKILANNTSTGDFKKRAILRKNGVKYDGDITRLKAAEEIFAINEVENYT